MSEMWNDIENFHKKFNLPKHETPTLLEGELLKFRTAFMKEELEEFEEAVANKDITKTCDALIDLVYVAMGTAYLMNVPWDKCWQHVQDANMQKIRALKESDSTRGSTYDIVKPKGWVAPDRLLLAEILIHEHYEIVRKNRELDAPNEAA